MESLSLKEVAEALGISGEHLKKLIKIGKIKAFDVSYTGKNKRLRITKEALNNYVKSCEVKSEV